MCSPDERLKSNVQNLQKRTCVKKRASPIGVEIMPVHVFGDE